MTFEEISDNLFAFNSPVGVCPTCQGFGNVMAMVFGNMGDTSATGVCFSRDAGNGENLFNGEYLINAHG